ncbi:hypothetical protein [Entomohabitans teleogrylli]|uniref:hypothetical protein n=1 Tax=Entomohabitans teleogrylli TaxID=1384589 RepID=UPI000B0F8B2C|nr:hypothetical protein [Entomohabitans teleogrylli]
MMEHNGKVVSEVITFISDDCVYLQGVASFCMHSHINCRLVYAYSGMDLQTLSANTEPVMPDSVVVVAITDMYLRNQIVSSEFLPACRCIFETRIAVCPGERLAFPYALPRLEPRMYAHILLEAFFSPLSRPKISECDIQIINTLCEGGNLPMLSNILGLQEKSLYQRWLKILKRRGFSSLHPCAWFLCRDMMIMEKKIANRIIAAKRERALRKNTSARFSGRQAEKSLSF